MKIKQEGKFSPITIVLETKEEAIEMFKKDGHKEDEIIEVE